MRISAVRAGLLLFLLVLAMFVGPTPGFLPGFASNQETLLEADPDSMAKPRLPEGFVWVRAGSFRMGSSETEPGRRDDERPFEVRISRDFWMQRTEVTQGQWFALMENNPAEFSNCGEDCPVENVNFWEALAYCNARSRVEGLEPCYLLRGCAGTPGRGVPFRCESVEFAGLDCAGYRLPTEAEWEYAARAGSTSAIYSGELYQLQCGLQAELLWVAWCCGSSRGTTHPVGLLQANTWALHDMIGNVWEWCWDWYGEYPQGKVADPMGDESGDRRVYRGGAWNSYGRYCRAAARSGYTPIHRTNSLGFRVVRSFNTNTRPLLD